MKNFTFTILIVAFTISIHAQITYTSASLPLPNDILTFSNAVDSTLQMTAPSSSPTTWDYSYLTAVNTTNDTILPASVGNDYASFPDADILQPLIGQVGGAGVAYTDVTANQIERIGGGLEIFGFSLVSAYSNTHILQYLPLTYGDNDSDDYALGLGANIDSVPFLRQLIDSLAGGFLPPGTSTDSIRFSIEGNDVRSVDAFGECILSFDTLDVIRQKIVSSYNLKIEVRIVSFLGAFWFDVTNILPLPFPNNATNVRYDFLSEGFKQPVVSVSYDSAELVVTGIQFMDSLISNPPNTINVDLIQNDAEFNIFPVPAKDHLNINFETFKLGTQVTFFDIHGRMIHTQGLTATKNQIDISAFNKGIYLILIEDQKGLMLASSSFIKR